MAQVRPFDRGEAIPKVFVVGQARSGTTWVRGILAQAPVVTGPESHLFPRLHHHLVREPVGEAWRERVLAAFDEGAAAGKAVGHQGPHRWVDRPTLERLLDETIDSGRSGDAAARWVVDEILTSYFWSNGGSERHLLVEKTPRHLRYADTILRWWPEARVVEVVRDGRDVCLSLRAKGEHRDWATGELDEAARRWAESVRIGRGLAADPRHRDRWLTVRYEDLSADPPAAVARILRFVGVDADDQRVADVVAATGLEQSRQPYDVHHVRAGVAGAWRTELDAAEQRRFLDLAADELRALGYDTA